MKKASLGFTLVELLIVMAIIAVLAAIVMAAVGGSRQTAGDTRIKTEAADAQEAFALYFQNNGDYGLTVPSGSCPTSGTSIFYSNGDIQSYIAALNAQNGNKTKCAAGTTAGSGNATSYAIASPVSYSTQYWCVDSNSNAKLSDNNLLVQIFAYFTSVAYAVPIGPNLGGGSSAAALCP